MAHDAHSIEQLIREHSDFVERLARRLLADSGAADDLSQEAWRVAIERVPRGIADFRAWVTGVLRNLARSHVRAEAARRRREQAAAAARAAGPDDVAARLDEFGGLVEALRRLREPYRTAIVLRYREGLAPRVIARRAGVPLETVKSRLKRGLALLRDDLRATHGGDEQAWRTALALLVPHRGRRMLAWGTASAALVLVVLAAWQLGAGSAARVPPRAGAAVAFDGRGAFLERGGTPRVRVAVPGEAVSSAVEQVQRLRLVDAATGEAVPDFIVASARLDPPLSVSNQEGFVRFAAPSGESLELRLIDHPRLRSERPIEAEVAGGELRLRIGPTYRLDLRPPPGDAERFDARLVAGPVDLRHRTSFAPVRVGERCWVRFGADAVRLGGGPPWRLEVRSDDGYRFGFASVDSVVGVRREPVMIALSATGRVRGQVAEPDGRPIDQAEVVLERGAERFAGVTDAGGGFDLCWVPPGEYELRARSHAHGATETAVVVRSGSTTEARLLLAPAAPGSIAGVLVSEAGRSAPPLPGPVAVVLAHEENAELTFVRTVSCAECAAGGTLATFHFDGIPAGRYRLMVRAPDFIRWQPDSVEVTPGGGSYELRRLDATPVSDLELRAVDAVTGAALAGAQAFVRLDRDDRAAKVLAADNGVVRLSHVPLDAAVEWTLRAPGHAPQRGDRGTLAGAVPLEPGWGNVVRCVDRAGRPVAGVEIATDGELAGATGPDGRLELRRDAPPARLAVRPGPWTPLGGDLLPHGRFRDLIWGITVTVDEEPSPEPGLRSSGEERK